MAINYSILKSSIIFSTIWMEDSDTRVVWVALLAMRNKDGEVYSSLPGLSHAARVGLDKTAEAVQKFLAPDPHSTTKDHEGRRLVEIPGGWRLLSHEQIKAEAATANKTVYMRQYMQGLRRQERLSRSLPSAGEAEYMAASRRGASQTELDQIIERHLPKRSAQ